MSKADMPKPNIAPPESKQGAVLNEYKRGIFLGKGGFARVYMVKEVSTGQLYAIKVIEKSKVKNSTSRTAKLKTEISIHESMRHTNIVGFVRFFSDSTFIYILLELCNNHCMSTLLKNRTRLTEPEVRYYMKQIVTAVDYMHRNRIIHRDLKLGNIFINNMSVKLGDFGLACKLIDDEERKKTVCGTPNYIAPEILQGTKKGSGTGHSYEVDIWSTGVIMYTLLVGLAPFSSKDVESTYKRIINNLYEFPKEIVISPEGKDLIRWMLRSDPLDRPKPRQILSHAWFKAYTPETLPKSALKSNPFEESGGIRSPLANRTNETNIPKPHAIEKPPAVKRLPTPPSHRENIPPQHTTGFAPAVTTEKYPYSSRTYDEVRDLGDQLGRVLDLRSGPASPLRLEQQNKLIWVTKWIDYSTKYGLGYKLSSGAYGVYFNDNTRICLQPDGRTFHYFEMTDFQGALTEVHITGLVAAHPPTLKKKITLLSYFKDQKLDAYPELPTPTDPSDVFILKKFMVDSNMIIFRFADGACQANFMDHTKILFNGKEKLVGYRTNMEPARSFKLAQVEQHREVKSRLDSLRHAILSNFAE